MICNKVEPLHHIKLESGHKVRKDRVIRIPTKAIPVEKLITEERVR
jgi:hypothetical protein